MNFLLKIVEGPNKGAEIALVEGIAITLGKADDCDIILADATLPDAPFKVEATDSGVMLDGEPFDQYHVRSAGSTAFAVGPADAAWGELVWTKPEKPPAEEPGGEPSESAENAEGGEATPPPESAEEPKRRRGCLGCLLALIVLLLILLGLGWFFREWLRPHVEPVWERVRCMLSFGEGGEQSGKPGSARDGAPAASPVEKMQLAALAAKYGLAFTNDNGKVSLSGNFRTRAERLAATAEAYAERPGVELDFSDDESFRTAAADALFTLTEGALKVAAASNRVLSIAGVSASASALKKTLEALNEDLPKLRNLDVSGVRFGRVILPVVPPDAPSVAGPVNTTVPARTRAARRASRAADPEPNFPVCGILTTPYPCLVMKNGARILEGAMIGDSTILKITSDSVVVTNSSGRFVWKP